MSKKTKSPALEFTKGQRVWISQWALSDGIKDVTFAGCISPDIKSAFYVRLNGEEHSRMVFRKHIHETEESAKLSAELMVDKRIKSLQKQISKLEQLKF